MVASTSLKGAGCQAFASSTMSSFNSMKFLEISKRGAEALRERAAEMFTPHSSFDFRESAPLSFASSTKSVGVQVADILAGSACVT